jgi:hypothetical protein
VHQINKSSTDPAASSRTTKSDGVSSRDEEGERDLTVWERQGLPQPAQMRLRTASSDSAKLVWEVASACACASSTLRSCTPQSPHRRDSPAIAACFRSREFGAKVGIESCFLAKRFRRKKGNATAGRTRNISPYLYLYLLNLYY